MNITWHGQNCFKISAPIGQRQEGQVIIITDPFGKTTGLKPLRTKADIVTISRQNNGGGANNIKENPFIIDGPGEYEIKNVFIRGINSFGEKQNSNKEENIIYIIEAEETRVCHLGNLGHILKNGQLEQIGQVDILMIPIGGNNTISWNQADEIINQIEPRVVIPMQYKIPGIAEKLDSVDKFLKEMGASSIKPIPKFSIKKKNLPQEKMEIVVLELT